MNFISFRDDFVNNVSSPHAIQNLERKELFQKAAISLEQVSCKFLCIKNLTAIQAIKTGSVGHWDTEDFFSPFNTHILYCNL